MPDRITVERLHEFDYFLDVRTPSEFSQDHLPGAFNCPVLDDAQRALVGTVYKQESTFLAKKMGAALVARNIADHLESRFHAMPKDWRPLVYCWRGGKRSAAMTHVLREVGWDARQLEGGYKAYRRYVLADLPARAQTLRLRVVCGLTGTGKTRLLSALRQIGEQVLDLEQLAHHKGSVLGGDPGSEQPSQKLFESRLWNALRALDPARVTYVESESKKVGNLRVPDALMTGMWGADCIWLSSSMQTRLALLMQEYTHFLDSPESLVEKLHCLRTLHGADIIARWSAQARAGAFDALITDLLLRHYDPAYLKSIRAHYGRLEQARQITLVESSAAAFEQAAFTLRAWH